MYLTQSVIADDPYMRLRVASCAAQQGCAEAGLDPDVWAMEWRRVWSAAPGWDVAWESAIAGGVADPGRDSTVVTDGQVLAQVQAMMPFTAVADHKPELIPR